MSKFRTIQIKLDDSDYQNLLKFKKAMKAQNWEDFCIKISKGDEW